MFTINLDNPTFIIPTSHEWFLTNFINIYTFLKNKSINQNPPNFRLKKSPTYLSCFHTRRVLVILTTLLYNIYILPLPHTPDQSRALEGRITTQDPSPYIGRVFIIHIHTHTYIGYQNSGNLSRNLVPIGHRRHVDNKAISRQRRLASRTEYPVEQKPGKRPDYKSPNKAGYKANSRHEKRGGRHARQPGGHRHTHQLPQRGSSEFSRKYQSLPKSHGQRVVGRVDFPDNHPNVE
ncbi:COP1-interacting protein-related [Striga asiatica]|uniref:COP1-interacting protein-related n=1 Tax=Striga asiatica TaxID=4170 RepID=A0A5A7PHA1_STRAF|nr:COP1-interacting protein-related [Striga asiatica]